MNPYIDALILYPFIYTLPVLNFSTAETDIDVEANNIEQTVTINNFLSFIVYFFSNYKNTINNSVF